jgi:thiosulfate dehydrogenase
MTSRAPGCPPCSLGGPWLALLVGMVGLPSCVEDAQQRGELLFQSRVLSSSSANIYHCSHCHDAARDGGDWIKPGALLAGATERVSYWGGQERTLLGAINQCRAHFMLDNVGLTETEADAIALYAYLDGLAPRSALPVEFHTVRWIESLPRGDAARGAGLYARACGYCHGAVASGEGRLDADVPRLPDETIADHEGFTPRTLRLVFIEKVRHGKFYGYGGTMPPFSLEVLTDEALADILEALGVLGE